MAAAPLLLAAGEEGKQPDPAADPQRANAFRAVELMRRDRQEVDLERLDVDGDFARRLHSVRVKQGPTLVRETRKLP